MKYLFNKVNVLKTIKLKGITNYSQELKNTNSQVIIFYSYEQN